jgi:hypothetical protein
VMSVPRESRSSPSSLYSRIIGRDLSKRSRRASVDGGMSPRLSRQAERTRCSARPFPGRTPSRLRTTS